MIKLTDRVRLVVNKQVNNKDFDVIYLEAGTEGKVISRRNDKIVVAIDGKKIGLHIDDVVKVRRGSDES